MIKRAERKAAQTKKNPVPKLGPSSNSAGIPPDERVPEALLKVLTRDVLIVPLTLPIANLRNVPGAVSDELPRNCLGRPVLIMEISSVQYWERMGMKEKTGKEKKKKLELGEEGYLRRCTKR